MAPGVELGIALSSIVLGALVLACAKPPFWTAMMIVSAFAVFHGYAHGAELPEGESGVVYSMGFVISTGLLHLAGICLGLIDQVKSGGIILRGLGALVLLAGFYFLWGVIA